MRTASGTFHPRRAAEQLRDTAGIAPTVAARAAHTYSQIKSQITSISNETRHNGRYSWPHPAVANSSSRVTVGRGLGATHVATGTPALVLRPLLSSPPSFQPRRRLSGNIDRPQIEPASRTKFLSFRRSYITPELNRRSNIFLCFESRSAAAK